MNIERLNPNLQSAALITANVPMSKPISVVPAAHGGLRAQSSVEINKYTNCGFISLFAVRSWKRLVMQRLFITTTPVALGSSSNFTSLRAETSRVAVSLTVSLNKEIACAFMIVINTST